jgi:hypothetical protein
MCPDCERLTKYVEAQRILIEEMQRYIIAISGDVYCLRQRLSRLVWPVRPTRLPGLSPGPPGLPDSPR